MRLRSKLILSFLGLAVVPLAALVLYSYWSSIRSLRQAVWEENVRLAADMSDRMEEVKDGVGRRIQRLGDLPFAELAAGGGQPEARQALLRRVGAAMGDVAPLVQSLEFIPTPAAAPPAPTPPTPPTLPAPPAPRTPETPPPGAAQATPAPAPAALPAPAAAAPERLVLWLDRPEEGGAEGAAAAGEAGGQEAGKAVLREVLTAVLEQVRASAAAAAAAREAGGSAAAPVPGSEAPPPGLPPDLERRLTRLATAGVGVGLEIGRIAVERTLDPVQLEALTSSREETERLLGRHFQYAVERGGEEIGQLHAQISAREMLTAVLSMTRRDRGEIPFAVDSEGQLYTARDEDRALLARLPLTGGEEGARRELRDWVVVRQRDPESGLVFGIARPIGESLLGLRRTAGRNFGYGLGLVALALVGVVPLSRRVTRGLSDLTEGARHLAAGSLDARVPVRSRDEVGQLAATFNQMAADLAENQQRLLAEERRRKTREIEHRLLAAENDRKTRELEEARRFQLSLLPRRLPRHPDLEVAVHMQTATEVGGDYYDFHLGGADVLTVAIGDATGHGASAGTMVTVIKSLFTARAADSELPAFLDEAAKAIRGMELGRMAMALALVRIQGRRMRVAGAGMPPVLLYRAAGGAVDEIATAGVPLGSLADAAYDQQETGLGPGDVALLMSDGFPELTDAAGEPQGYARARDVFAAAATANSAPEAVIAALTEAAHAWKGDAPPDDDMTFVVLRVAA
jgi:serine phosphatase RsbU (regulator of sigma subunit)